MLDRTSNVGFWSTRDVLESLCNLSCSPLPACLHQRGHSFRSGLREHFMTPERNEAILHLVADALSTKNAIQLIGELLRTIYISTLKCAIQRLGNVIDLKPGALPNQIDYFTPDVGIRRPVVGIGRNQKGLTNDRPHLGRSHGRASSDYREDAAYNIRRIIPYSDFGIDSLKAVSVRECLRHEVFHT